MSETLGWVGIVLLAIWMWAVVCQLTKLNCRVKVLEDKIRTLTELGVDHPEMDAFINLLGTSVAEMKQEVDKAFPPKKG